jgi:hypothetical protein
MTTSVPPEPALTGGSNDTWGGRLHGRPLLLDGGGGRRRRRTPDSSTAEATASPSSTCAGSGSAHRGWGWGSEDTTRTLWARRFRVARLSTPVSAYLREYKSKVNKQSKLESLR